MTWKGFGRKRQWPDWIIILELFSTDRRKPLKSPFGLDDVQRKFRKWQVPSASNRYTNLLRKINK